MVYRPCIQLFPSIYSTMSRRFYLNAPGSHVMILDWSEYLTDLNSQASKPHWSIQSQHTTNQRPWGPASPSSSAWSPSSTPSPCPPRRCPADGNTSVTSTTRGSRGSASGRWRSTWSRRAAGWGSARWCWARCGGVGLQLPAPHPGAGPRRQEGRVQGGGVRGGRQRRAQARLLHPGRQRGIGLSVYL